jgi:hypothetical protein
MQIHYKNPVHYFLEKAISDLKGELISNQIDFTEDYDNPGWI